MSDSADEIVKRMQDVRREASDGVKGIVESAKTLSDWRYHVQRHPWICVGAAAALGFFLIPKRKKASAENSEELIALLKKYEADGGSAAAPAAKGLAATLIGMAAPFVMRSAMQAAQQYFTSGSGPLAAFFGGPRSGDSDFADQGAPPDDEAAFRDFNIPR